MKAQIKLWNSLTGMQKKSFGDRWISNDSDLNAWNKPFNELSELKKQRVLKSSIDVNSLNFTIC